MASCSGKRKIILDTDPGGDDIFALLWLQSLVKQGFSDLVAVTTAEGNVTAQRTFSNASKVLSLSHLDRVEVGKGVPLPAREIAAATHIHGEDGMGNLSGTFPDASHTFETAKRSDDLIIEQLNSAPGEITIVAIAPLTNLAAAEAKCPGILQNAKEIVIMAGAFGCSGNVSAEAEFNIACNPEAAQTVLKSRNDSVILPLDITRQLMFTPEMAAVVQATNPDSPMARFMGSLCQFMTRTALHHRATQGVAGFLVHDAATLAYLFYPETLLLRRGKVEIETKGKWTRGKTVLDSRHRVKSAANAWIAWEVDTANFFASLIEDLKVLVQGKEGV